MIRRTAAEQGRRLQRALEDARRYPPLGSLTPEQQEAVHAKLLAQGWTEGRRRQHPWIGDASRCVDCGDECEPSADPLDRLCDRCRGSRRG